MQLNQYELKILVREKPVHEYAHDGRIFVEGRKGTEFEVQFKNNSSGKVLVIPSVDGISTLDGEKATPESKGYVVGAHASLVIPGWTVDDGNVAKFVFADKERSYVSHSENGTTNAGVVGVLVFAQKAEPEPKTVYRDRIIPVPLPYPAPDPLWPHRPRGPWLGVQPWASVTGSAADVNLNTTQTWASTSGDMPGLRGIATNSTTLDHGTPTGAPEEEESPNGLGTGWGDKADFKVNQVSFDKGELKGQMVIFYDTRRNLERRGIDVMKISRTYNETMPQAFTSVGCKPPPDWKG